MSRTGILLRDSKKTRWGMLLIISFVMFAAYIASDNIFSVEKTLMDPAAYGVTQVEYDNLAGAYSIFNVYLLMLIFGGLILDKMGIRFTGIMSCLLMVAGIGMLTGSLSELKSAVQAGTDTGYMNFLGARLRTPVFWAVMGIGIYGISALPDVKLAHVASFKCNILQIKHLKPEDGTVGYGRYGHIAPEGTVIATIPVGYADGIDRHLGRGNCSFSLNGHRVPTIGNICMDMCMLDITGVEAKVGDTVTIFGEDPTATELAGILDTIPYEIFTSVPRRIERVVIR